MNIDSNDQQEIPVGDGCVSSDTLRGDSVHDGDNVKSNDMLRLLMWPIEHMQSAVMKERYGWYGRYVDDFFVICNSSKECVEATMFAEAWLRDNLHLTLSRHKMYVQPYWNGVKFIGSVVKKSRIYAGSKTVGRFMDKVEELNRKPRSATDACVYLNSYLGFMQQGRTYRIRRDVIAALSDRYLRDIEVFNDYKKVLSRQMLMDKRRRREIKRYSKKRKQYYKRKQYETRLRKQKAMECGGRQNASAHCGQPTVWYNDSVRQYYRRRRRTGGCDR